MMVIVAFVCHGESDDAMFNVVEDYILGAIRKQTSYLSFPFQPAALFDHKSFRVGCVVYMVSCSVLFYLLQQRVLSVAVVRGGFYRLTLCLTTQPPMSNSSGAFYTTSHVFQGG